MAVLLNDIKNPIKIEVLTPKPRIQEIKKTITNVKSSCSDPPIKACRFIWENFSNENSKAMVNSKKIMPISARISTCCTSLIRLKP
jgi:hypothetical protein